ncbi:IclR family transcriptional regulator [Paenibacillus chartarius]|uniref:IclR family transcriptional regulator n=1 Tax=Paenibacillus chartarius TaxID=747481 RepID=A0ABV6DI21_9BACL
MKQKDSDLVQSVERALDILSCFTVEKQEQSIADLANEIHLPKSTISRLLNTLKSKNYIEQDMHTQKYRLGFRLFDLGNVYSTGMDLRRLAYPLMKSLNQTTSETVNLNIVDRGERVCIEKIESPHHIRNFIKVGERNSLCFGAAGKTLLAFLPKVEAEYLIGRENFDVEKKTELMKELEKIRLHGYCISSGNRIEGALAISAPIFDSTGQLVAGVSLSGPIERLSSKTDILTRELCETAKKISLRLGYNHRRFKDYYT